MKKVQFRPDRVVVEVALRRRRLVCPECGYSTGVRKDTRPENSVWRHLDLEAQKPGNAVVTRTLSLLASR